MNNSDKFFILVIWVLHVHVKRYVTYKKKYHGLIFKDGPPSLMRLSIGES